MKKRSCKLLLASGLLLLLTGCFSQSVDDLYAQPKAPEDYLKLDDKISQVLNQGGEYAAPLSGELTQKVQLQDLDGDGVQEAIAFFRVSSENHPLKIYIYKEVGDDYEVAAVIEGAGTAINSVYYENLDDSPSKEIIVSWQMSDKVHSLAAYSIDQYQVLELMRTDYTDFQVYDLDSDGQKEILVLQADAEDEDKRAELYNMNDGILELDSVAHLSHNVTGLVEGGVQTGYLQDQIPAVFVTSTYGMNGHITDIFAWKGNRLQNITLDGSGDEPDESKNTIRWYTKVSGTDINGDGILELPDPYELPDLENTGTAVNFWAIRWRQYDINGRAHPVYSTYYNDRDGWYFILPDDWDGKIAVSRSDLSGGGERGVIFSYWEGNESVEPVPFLVIYKLTGDNRVMRANLQGRFRLPPENGDDSDALYAARLIPGSWDCGLDEEGVKERFSLIVSSWSDGT